ncbi:class I SAM-dependent methyltransferase [Actinomycetaceae bacterium L2_0104]
MDQRGIDEAVQSFYAEPATEADRLVTSSPAGAAEFIRVQELVRHEIHGPSKILDVGGTTGIHSRWLAEEGHNVTLLDPVEAHVLAAQSAGTFEAIVGDARALPFPDRSFDLVLVFGPLYHLGDPAERAQALQEARRVVREEGVVLASGISRTAAITYQLSSGQHLRDEEWLDLIVRGQPPHVPGAFPAGHFHTSGELESELREAGLTEVSSEGIEGFAVGVEYTRGTNPEISDAMVIIARELSTVPRAKETSNHLMARGRRSA